MKAGNEILVPGQEDLPVQYIDAADMCGWMVRLLEDGGGSGPYNAVGAENPYVARPLLEGLVEATGSTSTLTWVPWIGSWRRRRGVGWCSAMVCSAWMVTSHRWRRWRKPVPAEMPG